jgi:hypothetical protein
VGRAGRGRHARGPGAARATFVTDPAGDILPTYLGPPNPTDLDVVGIDVVFDGSAFRLRAVVNGPVGTTPGGFYVWGVNRGAGAQGFPTIAPGVLFDWVVILNNNGTGQVAGFKPLPAGSVTISGNEIVGVVPLAALPSTGFAPEDYTWNLWPRTPVIPGNAQGNITDFAPDNSNVGVPVVPAPAGALLAAQAGLVFLAFARFRRR